jgi:UDP-N-acetylglucosamine--dolichyl-phosphate N-acetylglucosaminephosphotransferase
MHIASLIALTFIFTFALMPLVIRRLESRGMLAIDYYKPGRKMVPTGGGILILLSLVFFYAINGLLALMGVEIYALSKIEWYSALVVIYFGSFGLIDDFWDVGRAAKIFAPFFFSLPLSLALPYSGIILPFIGYVELGEFFLLFIAPLYVMVVSNLINMHSGFNGMAAGLSAMLMFTLAVKSFMLERGVLFMLSCTFGATLAFLWYNRYPSRIFDGNVGALSMGAAIGVGIISGGFLVSGFIMLIPHTINFLMYVYWRIMHKLRPEDERWRIVKFGRIREDGTLEVPNPLTLKWVLPYYFRVTEKQAVLAMYSLTAIFCLLSFPIPY